MGCKHKFYLDYIFENTQEEHQEYMFKCMGCGKGKSMIVYENTK